MTGRAVVVALLLAVLPGCRTLYWSLYPAPPQEEIAHLKHMHVALEKNKADRPAGWPAGYRLAATYTTPSVDWTFVRNDQPLYERTQDEVRYELSQFWWASADSPYIDPSGEYLALISSTPGDYYTSSYDGALLRWTDCIIRVYVKESGHRPTSASPVSNTSQPTAE